VSIVAGESWLLAEKLRVPRPHGVCRRDRVTKLIDQAVQQRVTLITGPAGAGKTVACATWAAGRRHRIAWLTLDERDRDPRRFSVHVAAALDGGPAVLVLDDVHELAGSEAAASLDLLVHHFPPSLRLILSGRFTPGLQLAKLRLGGELAVLGEEELACTEDEAEACFGALGLRVSPADRVALLGRTQGWMAGLRLIALAGAGGLDGGDVRDSPLAADYLRDEILDRQPPPVREFLLRASLAGELTADLGDRLAGEPGSGLILDRLCRENAFLGQAEEERYRLHPFVADLLAAELRRRSPEIIPGLLAGIADWHAERRQTASAARFAADAGDWVLAARLVADGGLSGLLPERADELATALAQLPAQVRVEHPAVDVALAVAWLCTGETDAAAAALELAERAAARASSAPGELKLWVAALRVMAEPDGTAAAAAGRALALEYTVSPGRPAEQRALGLLWLVLGTSSLRRQDLLAASTALGQAERELAKTGPAVMRERASGWRAVAEAGRGDLVAAEAAIACISPAQPAARPVPRPAQPAGDSGSGAACLAALAAAQCALDRDELAAAAAFLDAARGAPFAVLPGEPDPRLIGELIGARVRLADGGEPPAPGEHDGPLLRGRVLLASGDAPGALAAAERYLELSPGDDAPRDRLIALLLAAAAQRRLGAAEAAGGRLREALALAEPHRMVRPFMDGGTPVCSAITALIRSEGPGASFAAVVLRRFSYQPPTGYRPARQAAPLSGSELAVLRMLASHLTNREIAQALCLSVNTVKTHLRTTYRKLGVRSRREAIARGDRLGLL
jgi:LuxR family transcriptional regulator, maltose regulon positive regulatory protein